MKRQKILDDSWNHTTKSNLRLMAIQKQLFNRADETTAATEH